LCEKNEKDFSAIIIMYNSIGYSTTEDDLKVFHELQKVSSKDETILITQTENRDWRINNFESSTISEYKSIQVHERWRFNLEDSISEGIFRFYRKRYQTLHFLLDLPINLRLYSLHELKYILNHSGWEFVRGYGNILSLEQASIDSPEIVTVSRYRTSG